MKNFMKNLYDPHENLIKNPQNPIRIPYIDFYKFPI